MQKKKVYFFLSNLDGGGAQRTVINILNNINMEIFDPKLILLKYDKQKIYASLLNPEIPVVNLNTRGRYAVSKIIKLLKFEKPDVIFSTLPQVNIAVSLAHKLSKSKANIILRETNHREKEKMKRTTYYLLKWAYNYCDQIISLSKGVAKDFKMYNVNLEKVKVIYNPVEVVNISNNVCNFDKKRNKEIKLIGCGRLVPQKNFLLLIKALGNLKNELPNWNLDILGEGPELNNLKNAVIDRQLEDKINFLGFKDFPNEYMKNADLFILPSKWEGFGHVIVESMANGTPVLASNCPHGPEEIIGENKYGWLFENDNLNDLEEKLISIITSADKIEKMSAIAQNRAKDFEVKKIVEEYEKSFI